VRRSNGLCSAPPDARARKKHRSALRTPSRARYIDNVKGAIATKKNSERAQREMQAILAGLDQTAVRATALHSTT